MRLRTLARLGWRTLRSGGRAYPELEAYTAAAAAASIDGHARLEGARVLDLGSGHGSHGAALEALGARLVSVDLRPLGGPRPLRADALRLPLRDGSFDGIVCANMLEHVPSPKGAFAEMARVLRPGGWAYVCWTVWYSPLGGHEFSPWHYLGVRPARAVGRWLHLRRPVNIPGERLFPVHVGPTLRLLENGSPFRVHGAAPRYWPRLAWIVRVPGLREVATWNCLLLLERRRR
jgi:SAM-dependent methyltransferase